MFKYTLILVNQITVEVNFVSLYLLLLYFTPPSYNPRSLTIIKKLKSSSTTDSSQCILISLLPVNGRRDNNI